MKHQIVKVKCSLLAGDFEKEVNEYLPDTLKPMSYSNPTANAEPCLLSQTALKHGNVMPGFAELSTPKSSSAFTG